MMDPAGPDPDDYPPPSKPPRRCWWCARSGRRRLAVIALTHTRTHYCAEHWRAYCLLATADLLLKGTTP